MYYSTGPHGVIIYRYHEKVRTEQYRWLGGNIITINVFIISIIVLNENLYIACACGVDGLKTIVVQIERRYEIFLFYNELTFSSEVHSVPLFKYFSTVVQLKSGAYRVDGTESRPLVNSDRLLHLSCSDKYSSSSASIIIILFFSKFLASSMAACLVRWQTVCFILGGHLYFT